MTTDLYNRFHGCVPFEPIKSVVQIEKIRATGETMLARFSSDEKPVPTERSREYYNKALLLLTGIRPDLGGCGRATDRREEIDSKSMKKSIYNINNVKYPSRASSSWLICAPGWRNMASGSILPLP
jgi:hypothetical protein